MTTVTPEDRAKQAAREIYQMSLRRRQAGFISARTFSHALIAYNRAMGITYQSEED